MERVNDWRTRLGEHIWENRHRPAELGQHDCLLWWGSCRRVMTGIDPTERARGTYSTVLGAKKALKREGHETLESLLEAHLGPRQPIALAKAGDAVLADLAALGVADAPELPLGLSVGICNGSTSYFVGEQGLVPIPTLRLVGCHHG